MSVITLEQHLLEVEALRQQLEDLRGEKLAMAILLVKAAGGKITVSPSCMLNITKRSFIQEDRLEDGTTVFTSWEEPVTKGMH